MTPNQKNKILWIASFLAVIVLFQISYGLKVLVPTNVSWLMTVLDDWGQHYLGWFFYRNEPWHFPLGHITNLYYPLGTNVGFTDSIPLLAIFFKIFAPILPADFQYLGPWLLLCNLLAGYYTIRLFQLFTIRPLYTFLAVIFIVANPVLAYRGMHPALCAQWMLIASFYVYFMDPARIKVRKILSYQFILFMIAALVNPYIAFMVFGFTVFIAIKICFFDKAIRKKQFFAYLAGCIFFAMLEWWLVGMITFNKKEDLGVEGAYGLYSFNLNSLYNAHDYSNFLPPFKQVSWHQFESYMYLGMGIILILLFLLIYMLYRIVKKQFHRPALQLNGASLFPLLVFLVLVILFSITNVISINDKVLLRIPIPSFLVKLGDVFRASARFFWIPYYFILLFSIIAVSRLKISLLNGKAILILALIIQLYDIQPILTFRNLTYGPYEPPLDNKNWIKLMNDFDNITFFPPFESHQHTHMDYQYFCFLAARLKKPINIGYVARSDSRSMGAYSDSLSTALENGELTPSTLYVTTAPHLDEFSLSLQSATTKAGTLDGYYFIYKESPRSAGLAPLQQAHDAKDNDSFRIALKNVSRKIRFTATTAVVPPPSAAKPLRYWITRINNAKTFLSLEGWGFIDSTQNNKDDSIFIVLSADGKYYIAPASLQARPDVTSYFHKTYLDDAGYKVRASFDSIPNGKYQLGIAIKDAKGALVYQPDEHTVRVGVSEYATPEKTTQPPESTGKITYGMDPIGPDGPVLKISGWAAPEGQDADGCRISLVLKSKESTYVCPTDLVLRPDVTTFFKNKYKLDSSGFTIQVLKNTLDKGQYQVGILITDPKHAAKSMVFSEKIADIP